MDDRTRVMLEKTIREQTEELGKVEPGSKQYLLIMNSLGKLYTALNEADRLEAEFLLKDDAAAKDRDIEKRKIALESIIGGANIAATVAKTIFEWAMTSKFFYDGLNWENTGIVSSKINNSIWNSIFRFKFK